MVHWNRLRSRIGFSPDISATQAILFNPKYSRQAKITAYRDWLESNQPCVFGRVAAKNKNIFVCLLEENEILRMQNGDKDMSDTIHDHRQAWKRLALEGLTSSFVVLVISPRPRKSRAGRQTERDMSKIDGIVYAGASTR